VNLLCVPMPSSSWPRKLLPPQFAPAGLLENMPTASGPCSSMIRRSRAEMSSTASSYVAGRKESPTRRRGWVTRSGSWIISMDQAPLMQKSFQPQGLLRSGSILTTRSCWLVIRMPQNCWQMLQ